MEPQTLNWDTKSLADVHQRPDKAQRVRHMFDAIAPTYARINTLLSFGRDRAWRRTLVLMFDAQPNESALDIACGTGDVLRAFRRYVKCPLRRIGADFATQMMRAKPEKAADPIRFCGADALRLPFADASFDIVTCAFGVRNFQDLDRGLTEMHRVLRSRGRVAILEFSRPANRVIRSLHGFYSGRIMPVLAGWLSGDRTGAYRYLPRSVVSFASPDEMCRRIRSAGFDDIITRPLTFGVVTIYRAVKNAT